MSTVFVYPDFSCLWKIVVEKSVENVEKCAFSTGIYGASDAVPSCGKGCIGRCIQAGCGGFRACYVNGCKCLIFSLIPAKLFRFPGKLPVIKVTGLRLNRNFCEKLPKKKNGIVWSPLGILSPE